MASALAYPRLLAALAAALIVGSGPSIVGPALGSSSTPSQGPVDRAALERLLARPSIAPTGQARRFDLVVTEVDWELLPGVTTRAITFNGTVPGPTIRVTEGDAVEIVVRNESDESTSIHWHGLHVPNDQDGVAQGWMVGGAMTGMDGMSMDYDFFTINGRSFPATEPIEVQQGDLVRLRFINPSQTIHPMHLHGMDMAVFAKDGEWLPEPQRLNTLTIEQGETYDVVFVADSPGTWLLHCHDLHHASNDGVEPGGLIVAVNVRGEDATLAPAPSATATGSASPSQAPGHTMAPGMTEMPGMSSMPGMTH